MGSYLRSVWGRRYFWLALVQMDLRLRYRGSVLGMGWSLLQPVAMTTILCLVFHKLFHAHVADYAPFLLAGLTCWNFILNTSIQGCQAFFQAETYIRQYPTPLAVYPLRTVLGWGFHFLVALAVVVVLSWCLRGFGNLSALPCLVPAVALLLVFGWSLAVLGAVANTYFPDTQHLAEIAFQILFYLTPIMYPPRMLHDHRLGWLARYNPLVVFLELIRTPVLAGRAPAAGSFLVAGLTAATAAVAAGFMLRQLERRIIFQL
jgi:ABC-type polysaccharide/polyol phosphate export permease